MSAIVGREKELEVLMKAMDSPASEFIAIYGRRRVGKTFLVREAFENKFTFYLTGVVGATIKQQLGNFGRAINRYGGVSEPLLPEDWFAAFAYC